MTNTVNMLEGYNGEGSGTTSISAVFIIICALIARSSEGLLFGIPVFCAIFAFYRYNKFPAKVFPGDIGTLTIGASLALLGIMGGLEVETSGANARAGTNIAVLVQYWKTVEEE